MSDVEKKIVINATPEQTYNVLMDFPSYPEWNPMVLSIDGDTSPSSTLTVSIKVGARAPQSFKPTVLKNEVNREFRWVGKLLLACLYRGEHYFIIEGNSEGGCTFVHGERFSGVLSSPLNNMMGEDLPKAFEAFNNALKERVEKQDASAVSS
ncbi:hypothetical protein BWQ96_07047 [Gracilariopsis chorda]|uniref:SRPBCC domain-containing protein n=1 Tax=Gracilariopsis chorda TaxID=448386 RepID=A0A2V3IMB4_9FLOR|nr:hypothetical protein BWQ96_07047 [Gracilariopsis chorda]|eukprot:PXF43218.1 hypothetical protein BWQ96_07047 [Gracilariopsis chorda]